MVAGLKENGVYLIEAYTPEQVELGTGGGKSIETMTTKQSLEQDLSALKFLKLHQTIREIVEGKYHTGIGSVVQGIAVKI